MTPPPDTSPPKPPPSPTTVALASFIGTTIEWYDYLLFGAATVLILNPLFFPDLDPATRTLAGFGAIAVAFVARPLGGVFFGHFGDRIGRKRMLVLSLVIMGSGTVAIGLLPTYAQIGVWAPLLLVVFRFLQGFAVGGEWGGAVLMSLEHAPPGRRAFFASFPQAGVPAGVVLSSGALVLVDAALTEEQLLAWGWRIPFLASALLVAVGFYIRVRVTESPEFLAARAERPPPRVPAATVFARYPKALVIGMLCTLSCNCVFYLTSTFFLSYVPGELGIDRATVLLVLLVTSAVEVGTLPAFAVLADRWGARRFLLGGSVAVAAGAYPMFLLLGTGTTAGLIACYVLALPVLHAVVYGAVSGFTAELFPPDVRYSGSSLAYQLGGLVTAAPVPIIATLLLTGTGTATAIAGYLVAASLVGALFIAWAPTGAPRPAGDRVLEGAR